MNAKVSKLLRAMSDAELRSPNRVYVKLCAAGLIKEATTILMMDEADYQTFIMSECQDGEAPVN